MEFGPTLRSLRKSAQLTQEQLGKMVNLTKANISKYEAGNLEPNLETLSTFSKVFGVTVDQLLNGTPPTFIDIHPELKPVSTLTLPVLGEIACGAPQLAWESGETYTMPVSMDGDMKADFCLRAKGDSMIGAGIREGDMVLVRQQDEVENGEIAVVLIGDESTLKRVHYNEEAGEISLYPENPAYRPMHFREEELNQIRILGKAIFVHSRL